MKIVIVGTGNVAQVLGKMLSKANHTILQVFGRNQQSLNECAAILQAMPITGFNQINTEAEVCIIATSDSAIAAIAAQLHLPNTIIVHTSGGISINVLQKHKQYGVMYPLQSLRKELPYLPEVPLFVDGNNEEIIATITALAKTIAAEVHWAGDAERLKLHIAAVFCSNFINHLFALANQFCNSEHLHFNYLRPLIHETVHRMQFEAPENLQTGPAVRNDETTIQRHLQVLQSYPLLANVYEVLTLSIKNWQVKG
ncbi:DUF2520 domain-containing protein [Ilyomonas limi]|uniref:DUF2520 domain-containing protein n=1 Tax=Ilyomonas limi TaxID=2575867 RepID=A0A4U3L720_9BACT|nr:Rossmann-like and DUF2520 domain-containing protein [Ilyomonas limi]TKK70812.1 DUF2520 domain-containing protein [Ilyomonas limi]